jgi:hypothetical protein
MAAPAQETDRKAAVPVRQCNIGDCLAAQVFDTAISYHGSCNAGRKYMRSTHRKTKGATHSDSCGRTEFGTGSLSVGQVCFAYFSPIVTTMRFQPIMVPTPKHSE